MDEERRLRWAKWDVWYWGALTLGYICYFGWLWYDWATRRPWGWISLTIVLIATAFFAWRTRRAFHKYIDMKERAPR